MRRGRAGLTASRTAPALFPGEGGMVLLRYIGGARDRRLWRGPVTRAFYEFGPGETRFVDKRDAVCWLKPMRGNGRAFEEVRE